MQNIDWNLTLNALTLIVVAIGAWKGIREFQLAQKWRRAEFLAQKHKDFTDNLHVQKAMTMLDGFSTFLSINKNEFDGKTEYIDFVPNKLTKALTPLSDETKRPREETYIRICIDKFLFRIGVFQRYLDNNLVDKGEVLNLLGYWIKAIGDKNDNVIKSDIKRLLHNYIIDFQYKSTIDILQTYGYTLEREVIKKVNPKLKPH
jgi:hypothetical protein